MTAGKQETVGAVTWNEVCAPLIARFEVAAQFGMEATWNAEGSRAMAILLQKMADLLDREVKARADAAVLSALIETEARDAA